MTQFGASLKHWRTQRRMSQLDLGLGADVSARHISFLETGRSRPSRAMVLQLCEELDVPRAARNAMLNQAGLAAAYEERSLSDEDMAPVQSAIGWMLDRHAPYPALALDRHWRIVDLNVPAKTLLGALGIGEGGSLVAALIETPALQEAIANLAEVIAHLRHRLRTESAHYGGDTVLDTLERDLAQIGGQDSGDEATIRPAFVPTRYRFGGSELSLLSTFAQFGTAEDIALNELRIELMFPADEATRLALLALSQHPERGSEELHQ
ncbi:MAG: helix-turn-helix transcriptional regulator [Ahrensia sp.]|nr:helix-turn-helix transcriptional regulator [Ahrensia sp.]